MKGYEYFNSGSTWDGSSQVYSEVFRTLESLPRSSRVLDAGCGNGHLASLLAKQGFQCYGADTSPSGITIAREACPEVAFSCIDLAKETGSFAIASFDAIVCIEVIEHVYAPREILENLGRLLKPGGRLILSTPYHGYAKNLALAAAGRFDRHFNPLWDHGHIKFFSRDTLLQILNDAGFEDVSIRGVGRFMGFWKTMLAVASKPKRALADAGTSIRRAQ